MHHVTLDRWSRGESVLHRRDARVKVLALAAYLVAVATLDAGQLGGEPLRATAVMRQAAGGDLTTGNGDSGRRATASVAAPGRSNSCTVRR